MDFLTGFLIFIAILFAFAVAILFISGYFMNVEDRQRKIADSAIEHQTNWNSADSVSNREFFKVNKKVKVLFVHAIYNSYKTVFVTVVEGCEDKKRKVLDMEIEEPLIIGDVVNIYCAITMWGTCFITFNPDKFSLYMPKI